MKEFFREVTDPNQTESSARNDDESMVGRHIGSYRIEREIGHGGMGTVFEAWRADGEFQHRVAIKLIRSGLDHDFVFQRFRNERQILAALLDQAATQYVKPYFIAMAQVALGNYDAAVELLQTASAERDPWLVWFGTDPKLDPIRTDPRFIEIFRATKNPMALPPGASG